MKKKHKTLRTKAHMSRRERLELEVDNLKAQLDYSTRVIASMLRRLDGSIYLPIDEIRSPSPGVVRISCKDEVMKLQLDDSLRIDNLAAENK